MSSSFTEFGSIALFIRKRSCVDVFSYCVLSAVNLLFSLDEIYVQKKQHILATFDAPKKLRIWVENSVFPFHSQYNILCNDVM